MPPSVAPLTASIPPEIPGHVIDVLTLIATPCRDSASAAVPTETDPRVSAAARAQALAGGVTLADITLGPALCRRAGRPATPATLEQIEGADGLRWRITADADAGETLAGLNARRKGYATRKNMEAKVFSALGMAPQAFVLACRALVEEVQRASSAEVAAWAVDPADDDALRTLVARAAARLAEDVGLVALYRYHLAAAAVVAGESRGEETAAQCTAASA